MAGASYAATVAKGPIKGNPDPIKSIQPQVTFVGVQGRSEKLQARTGDSTYVDEELLYYLWIEFAGEERNARTYSKMWGKMRKHLRSWDTTKYTKPQLFRAASKAVAAAMRVPPEEQEARQFLKDQGTIEEMTKHNKFVSEGKAGRLGSLFKTSHDLPRAK